MTPNVDNLSKTNLYIRGLQSATNDEDLYNMCREFGHITSTKAIIDKGTGCCRGYGFVEFTEPKSAELAVKELTKSGVQAQMAKISQPFYNSNQQNQNHSNNKIVPTTTTTNNNNNNIGDNSNNINLGSNQINNGQTNNNNNNQNHQKMNYSDPTNLYIANLPQNMTEQELQNLLSHYGPVVSTRILRDHSNVPRGVGFARMETRENCEQIIRLLNGKPFEGSKEPLLLKFADSGNKKRRQHNNHHHHHQMQHHHSSNNSNNSVHNNNNSNNNQNNNNNINHQQLKSLQDDSRWRDSSNTSDLGSVSSLEHQTNTSHSDHLSDLAMMAHISYPRMQPGFPPNAVASGATFQNTLVSSSPGQWIPSGPGQPYVIPQQVIQSGGLGPTSQQSAAALHYGHMSQLTYQMQGVQIGHHEGQVGGYLAPQHQWSSVWSQPIATSQQGPHQGSMRVPLPIQQQAAPAPVLLPSQQQ